MRIFRITNYQVMEGGSRLFAAFEGGAGAHVRDPACPACLSHVLIPCRDTQPRPRHLLQATARTTQLHPPNLKHLKHFDSQIRVLGVDRRPLSQPRYTLSRISRNHKHNHASMVKRRRRHRCTMQRTYTLPQYFYLHGPHRDVASTAFATLARRPIAQSRKRRGKRDW